METKHLPVLREAGRDLLQGFTGFQDLSGNEFVLQAFIQLGFTPGFAATGSFPGESYSEEAKKAKVLAGEKVAELIMGWAHERKRQMDNSKIFLSHKGVNKPLVEKIDRALRQLSLTTWFDRDDLAAGDPLVRGVDNAFATCSAAVFFISSEYVDDGVIAREVDRAITEQAMRKGGFRIIPLVLSQHGGSDDRVPGPLQTLTWKTVEDSEIVPAILRAIPSSIQGLIRYSSLK
jgi:hypothetical protein